MRALRVERGWQPFDFILGFESVNEAASFEMFLETVLRRVPHDEDHPDHKYDVSARAWAKLLQEIMQGDPNQEMDTDAPANPENGR